MKASASLGILTSRPQAADRPGRKLPAWTIPLAILLGFAALFMALFGDRLLPAPGVEVATVLATAGEQSPATTTAATAATVPTAEGSPLFQASGWIEPAPLPVKATALVDGVVETVEVLPGQVVKKGDLLATLISEDARLALATAEQNHRTLQATATAHQSAIAAARKKAGGLGAQVSAAATLRDEAEDRIQRLLKLPAGAVPQSDVVAARLRRDREESQHAAALSAVGEAEAGIEQLVAESEVREHEVRAAALEVEKARLALDRTKITAPCDGRILRLFAAPGQKKMLEDQDPESSTIAILYRPRELQVRVDVPLADAAALQTGQHVRIRCSLLPDQTFTGQVTLISGEADLQRNTLQAKVSIIDPVDQLRPEMLCRVEFLEVRAAPGDGTGPSDNPARVAGALSTWAPEQAITDGAAWVCDPESRRVMKRAVSTTTESRDGFRRISGGLQPGEWVILSPSGLRDGQRVTPTLIEK